MNEPEHVSATRTVYDHSAAMYVEAVGTELSDVHETALDRALLSAFASDTVALGGPALDVGCGVGRATAHLASLGVNIRGIDISPAMVDAAAAAHPGIEFAVGELTSLGVPDGSLAGVSLWYSIIHTPPTDLSTVWAEIARVLQPGGQVLVAFQAGSNDAVERVDAYGSSATLVRYHHALRDVAGGLEAAGLTIGARVLRARELEYEDTPQAFVTARQARSA